MSLSCTKSSVRRPAREKPRRTPGPSPLGSLLLLPPSFLLPSFLPSAAARRRREGKTQGRAVLPLSPSVRPEKMALPTAQRTARQIATPTGRGARPKPSDILHPIPGFLFPQRRIWAKLQTTRRLSSALSTTPTRLCPRSRRFRPSRRLQPALDAENALENTDGNNDEIKTEAKRAPQRQVTACRANLLRMRVWYPARVEGGFPFLCRNRTQKPIKQFVPAKT